MKIELVESTLVYNISVDEKEYTLYVSENQNQLLQLRIGR
jgi:hypothetical protein